jgi:hypothetical protein
MNGFLARAGAAAAAGVVLGTVMVTAASASGGGGATARHGALGPAGIAAGRGGALARSDHATGRAARPANSRYFAGYQATVRAGSATVVVASFTVPALSCTTADRAIAASVGVPVRNYRSASAAFVFTGCVNGKAVYYPGLVVNGTEKHFTKSPFAAGDVIDLTTKVSTNRTRVQVTDVTTSVTQKIIGAGGRARAAWVGDEGWGNSRQLEHVPDFGKLTFKNCLIDGKALAGWHPVAIQRVNSRGTVQISIGGFWPGGNTFTTHFKHS